MSDSNPVAVDNSAPDSASNDGQECSTPVSRTAQWRGSFRVSKVNDSPQWAVFEGESEEPYIVDEIYFYYVHVATRDSQLTGYGLVSIANSVAVIEDSH